MSDGVSVIRYLLANNSPLIAVVPATRIRAGDLPLNTVLPAISVKQISGTERENIRRGSNVTVTDRIQITVLATTYVQQQQILKLAKTAADATYSTINTVMVDSITFQSTGPDFQDDDPVIFEKSFDVLIRYFL